VILLLLCLYQLQITFVKHKQLIFVSYVFFYAEFKYVIRIALSLTVFV